MTERVDRAAEVREWRAVVALTMAAGAAGAQARTSRTAQERYERKRRSAKDAERRLKGRAREEEARWAAGVLADPDAVVLSFATARSGERMEALEVALLDTGGRTLLHGRAEADLDPAEDRPRLRDCLREALAPEGSGRRRVVVFDRPPVLRLLARHAPGVLRTLSRGTGRGGGPGGGDAAGIEDARTHFFRAYGEWSLSTEDYCSCTFLPRRDDTALGDARAKLALVEKLADEGGASAPGGPGLGCLCAPEGAPEPGLCPLCEEVTPGEGLVFVGNTIVCRRCAEDVEAF